MIMGADGMGCISRGYQPEIAASDNKLFTLRRAGAAWSHGVGYKDVLQEV
jgi:hypothetical protein